jgi:hypothetical protein
MGPGTRRGHLPSEHGCRLYRARVRITRAALLIVLLAVAGCSSDSDDVEKRPTPTAVASTSSATEPVLLRTPSGNVTCRLTARSVECTPTEHNWGVYASLDDGPCTTALEVLVRLTSVVEEGTVCHGITARSAEVLGYGELRQVGLVRCVSEREALSCARTDSGEGFTMSRTFLDPHATPAARGQAPVPPPTVRELPADTEYAGFVTPTAGTICDVYEGEHVVCHVYQRTWETRPYDEAAEGPCEGDRAGEVVLDKGRPGTTVTTCRSDSLGGGPVLGYGDTLRVGPIECIAERSGVTCRNTDDGHGFTASRDRFHGF